MGLDTSHNAWHGPYSSFNRFRERLAGLAGIDLNQMEGFGGSISWDTFNDAIEPLLNHSDCDGEIEWQKCKALSERLTELAEMPLSGSPEDLYFKSKVLQFATGAIEAYNKKENIDFH